MAEWKTTTLGEVVAAGGGKIQTGPFGSQLHASDYVDVGIPCIMPMNMKDNRVDLTGIARITEKDAQRLSRHLVKEGDIVYSRRGDVTQKALIREGEAGYFCGTGCVLVRPGDAIDPEFLTYQLSTAPIKEWLVNQSVGGTMPNLNTGILSKVPLSVPDRVTQKRIASVLSVLDAKITLNQRINAELEAMAKLLYDYWFVQVDFPDAKGRPYKSSGGRMVYNAVLKREVPEGWQVKPLSELVAVSREALDPGSEPARTFKHFSIPAFDLNGAYLNELGDTIKSSKFIVRELDLLVSKLNPRYNRVVYAEKYHDAIASSEFVIWRCKEEWMKNFLFMVAKSTGFISHCSQSASGTSNSHKRVEPDVMMRYPVAYDEQAVKAFGALIGPFIKLQLANQYQNQELTALRDWLLPLLMNGQVVVGEAAEKVGMAMAAEPAGKYGKLKP